MPREAASVGQKDVVAPSNSGLVTAKKKQFFLWATADVN